MHRGVADGAVSCATPSRSERGRDVPRQARRMRREGGAPRSRGPHHHSWRHPCAVENAFQVCRCCSNRGHDVCSDSVMSGQQSRRPGMPCASRAVLKPPRPGCAKPGSSTLRDDLATAATLRSLIVGDDRMPTRPRPAMRRGCWSWQPPRTTVRQWRTRCDGRLSCAIPLARPSNGARRTDGTSGGTPTFPTAEQASRDLPVG